MLAGRRAGTVCHFQEFHLALNEQLGRDGEPGEATEVTVANRLFLSHFHKSAAFLSYMPTNCPIKGYSGLWNSTSRARAFNSQLIINFSEGGVECEPGNRQYRQPLA